MSSRGLGTAHGVGCRAYPKGRSPAVGERRSSESSAEPLGNRRLARVPLPQATPTRIASARSSPRHRDEEPVDPFRAPKNPLQYLPERIDTTQLAILSTEINPQILRRSQILIHKIQMTKTSWDGRYDLEDRTFEFARRVRAFVKRLPRTVCNREDVKQVVRSSGSVGADYIEANEALSKKDFKMRIRISRKESKESRYWLRLLDTHDDVALNSDREHLAQEATELMRIFGSILNRSQ